MNDIDDSPNNEAPTTGKRAANLFSNLALDGSEPAAAASSSRQGQAKETSNAEQVSIDLNGPMAESMMVSVTIYTIADDLLLIVLRGRPIGTSISTRWWRCRVER